MCMFYRTHVEVGVEAVSSSEEDNSKGMNKKKKIDCF